ncbi:uncharacterized protein LOC133383943 isoform X1 [Rhineura floridana]|uniref:uncharacterized protein LOC133383943 isoform X1 n=1 Tax=Rhineura floridana TaxID=261503 RepID=UPI002AC7F63E|nr:uncharacterized protein LOC133383943 isoform X1 [Rhineura floridana]XP_061481610.1 uncharacterized protein LOC133383943 isoform X1 [Rhineura floridana]
MASPAFFPPSVKERKILVLLYADDLVLLSLNRIGLKRMLHSLLEFSDAHLLQINYSKSKIMVCGKNSRTKHTWHLNGHHLEQVNTFKYLGIHINNNLSWSHHLAYIKLLAIKTLGQLKKFFYSRGGQLVRPFFNLYVVKFLPMILYGSEIWGPVLHPALEKIQNNIFKQILALPKCTPATHIRAELNLPTLKARIDLSYLRYWQKLTTNKSRSLVKLCWEEQLQNGGWATHFTTIATSYDLTDNFLNNLNPRALRNQIFEFEAQQDNTAISSARFSSWFPLFKTNHEWAPYLDLLTKATLCRAYTELRFQVMPSAYLQGRYLGIPYANRLCVSGCKVPEDLIHYMLICPLFRAPRNKFLVPMLTDLTESQSVVFLLSSDQPHIIIATANFALAAKKLRASYVKKL